MKLQTVIALSLSAATLSAGSSWACSLTAQPNEQQFISADGGTNLRLADGGVDDTAPTRPIISNLKVRLIANACEGIGSACPQNDTLSFRVEATDNSTAVEKLRYVASFGDSQAQAAAAPFTMLFSPDTGAATQVSAYLGTSKVRSESDFARTHLCFTLAAVDEAGNVGERSEGACVNTTDTAAPTTEVVNGTPCPTAGTHGCSVSSASALWFISLLVVALLRRRSVQRHRVALLS